MIGLVRSFARRRNISSSRKYYCYIVIGTEFNEKLEQLILEQAFCCASISSGLKTFVLSSSLRTPDPYLLLKSPRPLFSSQGPQTSSSLRAPDSFSTYLRISSLITFQAPLSMGFSRQGYWSGLPFPPPGDGSSWPRDRTQDSCISCTGRWILYHCATQEALLVV